MTPVGAKVLKALTRLPSRPPAARHRPERRPARPTTPGRLPRYLDQGELRRFFQTIKRQGSTRDQALFSIMYRYALRAIETTYLLREDVNLARRRITIRRAKSGESKEYSLAEDLAAPLKRYLRQRIDRGPYLFTGRESSNQVGLDKSTIRRLFKEYSSAAGLPANISSHSLRHSMAVHAREAGWDLPALADLLGHKSVRSTMIYAQVRSKARDRMIEQLARSKDVVRIP